jgi:dephospho-CoA kinase
MIIGLTGKNGSGKGTVAEILVKAGYEYHSLSDVIRVEIRKLGQDVTRERMIEKGCKLRREGGPGALAEIILKELKPGVNYIVDSVRNPGEVDVLRCRKDFVLVDVEADREVRFERCKTRARENDPVTLAEFIRLEEAELKSADPAAQQLVDTAAMADAVLRNDSTREDLERRTAELLARLEGRA